MDPGKGRGRGLALLEALKKSTMMESPPSTEEPTPSATPAPSHTPSVVASTPGSSVGGRGRLSAILSKMNQEPKPGVPLVAPASDVNPGGSTGAPRGVGRGLKLLENLKAVQSAKPQVGTDEPVMTDLVKKFTASTVSGSTTTTATGTSMGKNKYYKEVKDTPPVVMKGESGRPVEVTSNYIRLNFVENNVFEYEVKYEPAQDYKSLRFKLLSEHKHLFKEKAFDGTTLYLPQKLENDVTTLTSTNPFDNSNVKVIIIFRRNRKLSEMIHIYNVLFNSIMKDLQLVRFGRQYYSEHAAIPIPQHKLEVWPGYVTAVDEYEGGLMLTLDATHRVLRTQSVLSLIHDTVQRAGASWKKDVAEMLVGSSVMTTYNKKLFRVDTIDDTMSPRSTFERMENGQLVKISFVDYYKKNYGIDIMDWDQPMLVSKDKKYQSGSEQPTEFIIMLVPELCQLTGLSEDQRNNFQLMKDVAAYTRVTPNQRHAAFKKYIENVMKNDTARARLAGWGLSVAPETVQLTARTLPPETIMFGRGVKVEGKPNADWNGDVTRQHVMAAVDILRWAVLHTRRDEHVARNFIDIVMRSAGPMGINVSMPEMVLLPTDRTDSYINALKQVITSKLQIVVAICPTSRDDRYAAIKKICCAETPVPSQVINSRTLMNEKKVRGITQKILLQMNCKLGGTLWGVSVPFKSAMVVGIDSYHDASQKQRSVCCFVASYNQALTSWYSRAVFQQRGQELADGLRSSLVAALKHYLRVNGHLPDRIIMYRDGVGDGQLDTVKNYEIPQMMISVKDYNHTYKPQLTYVVVQKRINTRIFLKERGGLANPAPGTVLDHTVTRRNWYDFLIVSQKVTQGTVTPSHYIVLQDESNFTPDQLQRLTYKLCHLYYNWPGTVRVPAPCQYAHKLAYLVGQSVHQQPAEELSDKLFFL